MHAAHIAVSAGAWRWSRAAAPTSVSHQPQPGAGPTHELSSRPCPSLWRPCSAWGPLRSPQLLTRLPSSLHPAAGPCLPAVRLLLRARCLGRPTSYSPALREAQRQLGWRHGLGATDGGDADASSSDELPQAGDANTAAEAAAAAGAAATAAAAAAAAARIDSSSGASSSSSISGESIGQAAQLAGTTLAAAAALGALATTAAPSPPARLLPDRERAAEDAAYAVSRPITEGMSEKELLSQAAEWGYDRVGQQLPAGAKPEFLAERMPAEFFETDALRALAGLVAPLAVLVASYWWLGYNWGLCAWWQAPLAWVAIGTAYTGLFSLAHECSHNAFLPDDPVLQDVIGCVLMAPSLFALGSWRLRFLAHLAFVNMLHEDDVAAWHPLTTDRVAQMGTLERSWARLCVATPLKLLSSIGFWVSSWDRLDLKMYAVKQRRGMLHTWLPPVAFVGLAWPAMVASGGLAGWASLWLAPWLVFHVWLSLLTLLRHTAPHIPFRPYSIDYDMGQAVVSGTVTVRLPWPLEMLLNNANYVLHQHISIGIPFYRARAVHEWLQARLGAYMTDATLNLKLITNLVTHWQVYDTSRNTYGRLDAALAEMGAQEQGLGAHQM